MIRRSLKPRATPDTPAADNWARLGTCAQPAYVDQADDLWWASNSKRDAINEAIRLCHECPVRKACLDDALRAEGNATKDRRFGIRGGLVPTQRRRLYDELQRRRKAAA